ncbi:hypothetical protein [Streptomyces sp. NPDC085466]|uniref:hypothetical protein n=1 Tax=Streptomyces sp. NPDC085466 TaxID=3365725 RepID=UPI0037CD34EA
MRSGVPAEIRTGSVGQGGEDGVTGGSRVLRLARGLPDRHLQDSVRAQVVLRDFPRLPHDDEVGGARRPQLGTIAKHPTDAVGVPPERRGVISVMRKEPAHPGPGERAALGKADQFRIITGHTRHDASAPRFGEGGHGQRTGPEGDGENGSDGYGQPSPTKTSLRHAYSS